MFAVKIAQSGGLQGAASVASIAAAAGIELYGGTMLEGAAGTMASAQLFSTFDSLKWGTELFGPLLLTEEILVEPLRYADFKLHLPAAPGLGITFDWYASNGCDATPADPHTTTETGTQMNKQAIDALLKTFDDAAEKPGNPRVRAIVNRIVKDICYTIEDFDVQPSEFWTALNYLNEAGREFGLIAAASASSASSTCAWTKPRKRPASRAARRARSKGRCMSPVRRNRSAMRVSTTAPIRARR